MMNFSEVDRYILSHMAEQINVVHIADHFHFSTAQLYRIFVRETGRSPQQYIMDYKLEYGCAMIREAKYSFREISEALGFRYESHFFRQFKNELGVTPSEYKRHMASFMGGR